MYDVVISIFLNDVVIIFLYNLYSKYFYHQGLQIF